MTCPPYDNSLISIFRLGEPRASRRGTAAPTRTSWLYHNLHCPRGRGHVVENGFVSFFPQTCSEHPRDQRARSSRPPRPSPSGGLLARRAALLPGCSRGCSAPPGAGPAAPALAAPGAGRTWAGGPAPSCPRRNGHPSTSRPLSSSPGELFFLSASELPSSRAGRGEACSRGPLSDLEVAQALNLPSPPPRPPPTPATSGKERGTPRSLHRGVAGAHLGARPPHSLSAGAGGGRGRCRASASRKRRSGPLLPPRARGPGDRPCAPLRETTASKKKTIW